MRRFPRPPRIRGTPQFVPIEGVRTPRGNSDASSRGAGGARAYPSTSSASGHCASPSAPAPIENMSKEVRFEIAAAPRSGTTSSSAANASLLKGLIAFKVVGTPSTDSAAFLLWIAAVHVLFQRRLRMTLSAAALPKARPIIAETRSAAPNKSGIEIRSCRKCPDGVALLVATTISIRINHKQRTNDPQIYRPTIL